MRFEITASLVRRLLLEQFPEWSELPIAPVDPGGWDNRTFRLGDELAVRVPSAPAYAAQPEKEHRWLREIATSLPVAVPVPVALGVPSDAYPGHWSIKPWIDGQVASLESVGDPEVLARDVGAFLRALRASDATGGPAPGDHSFFRGGPLAAYDREVQDALSILGERVDTIGARACWDDAMATAWGRPPVWVHGDVAPSNLLLRGGRLVAVIDFGCCSVGDPACDLTMAWTFFTARGRTTFREAAGLDRATWRRARGWALWKALVTLARPHVGPPTARTHSKRVLDSVLGET